MKKLMPRMLIICLISFSATLPGGEIPDAQECATHAEKNPVISTEFLNSNAPYPASHASSIAETAKGEMVATWFGGTHERHPDVGIWLTRQIEGTWQEPMEVANGLQEDGSRYPTWNPVLFSAPDGRLFLFYKVGPNPREWWGMVMISKDDGATWSTPEALPDGILGPIKNKPVVLADGSWLSPSSTETPGLGWRVHFEQSSDQGKTWKMIGPVDPGVGFDAIQPSILFFEGGKKLEAVGRTRQGSVFMTWSEDGGKSWSPVAATTLPNPSSGTDAVTLKDGRQLIVYNHYGHLPSQSGKGLRYPLNIALSQDGVSWDMVLVLESDPLKDGYAYPAVIQAADGLLHITYTWDRKKIKHVVVDPKCL